jgi:ATP-binding cassette subfamily B protein
MIRKTMAVYWAAIRPRKWLWLTAFVFSLLFYVGNDFLRPLLISRFVGELTNISGKQLTDFLPFVWLWLGENIAQVAVGRVGIYIHFRVMAYTLMDIDVNSFKVTLGHGSDFFANNFSGALATKFNRFTRSFETLAQAGMFKLCSLLVQVVAPFIFLLFVAPVIAFVLLIWSLLFAISLAFLHKHKLPKARAVSAYDSRITGAYADVVTNALSVKMFARSKAEINAFEKLSFKRAHARLRNMYHGDMIRVYKMVVILVLESTIFLLSAQLVISGRMSLADALLVQLYVQQLATSLWNFGKLVEKLEEAVADAAEMTDIYLLTPSVQDAPHPQPLQVEKGALELQAVSFSYKDGDEQAVFKHTDLIIPAGQKLGVVGPSGGGKTTLTKLLLRFMDVESGKILLDGQDISRVTQDDLRRAIAYVPQEPLLFHRSIYDNIAYGDPKASREEVLKAARLAHADEFITRLPHGYETLVGERGVKLSGGQKQRVAIARAMLKKAPILLLDEATSALDSKSDKHITAALDNLM